MSCDMDELKELLDDCSVYVEDIPKIIEYLGGRIRGRRVSKEQRLALEAEAMTLLQTIKASEDPNK